MSPAHLGETSEFRLGGRGGEEVVRAHQLFGSLVVLSEVKGWAVKFSFIGGRSEVFLKTSF